MTSDLHVLGDRLLGDWTFTGTHPLVPGEAITGSSRFEWLGAGAFLQQWTAYERSDFPDALAVFLPAAGLQHYYDVRGVHRSFALTVSPDGWTLERPRKGEAFAQRLQFRLESDRRLHGTSQLCTDGVQWQHDLELWYDRC